MQTRTPRKTGVPGVLGVPRFLEARHGGAFSDGTQLQARWNTWCSEHQWCSVNKGARWNTSGRFEIAPAAGQAEHDTSPALPWWPMWLGRTMEHKQALARGIARALGAWGEHGRIR